MGIKISEIVTGISSLPPLAKMEISKLISTGPDVWETEYITGLVLANEIISQVDLQTVLASNNTMLTGQSIISEDMYSAISLTSGFHYAYNGPVAGETAAIDIDTTQLSLLWDNNTGNSFTLIAGASDVTLSHTDKIILSAPLIEIKNGSLIESTNGFSTIDFQAGTGVVVSFDNGTTASASFGMNATQSNLSWTDLTVVNTHVLDVNGYQIQSTASIVLDAPYTTIGSAAEIFTANGNVTFVQNDDTLFQNNGGVVEVDCPIGFFNSSTSLQYSIASRILSTDSLKNIIALDTSTYPTLAELAFLKGVTAPLQGQINPLIGGVIYVGVWNANTNSPTIVNSTGTNGNYYKVSVAGTTTIDGNTNWHVGDWIVFNGLVWEKVDNYETHYTGISGVTISGFNISLDNSYFNGDATIVSGAITLASVISANTKGAADKSLTITYDTKGRLTAVTENSIAIAESQVTGLITDLASKQPLDATLTAFAALTIAADTLTIGTGVDAFNQTSFAANTFPAKASTGNLVAKTMSDFALTILDDANAAAVRTTIGAGTGNGDLISTNNLSDLTSASIARTNLGLNTTANQSDSTNKRFVTDAQLIVIGNTSNTNSGDNAANSLYSGLVSSQWVTSGSDIYFSSGKVGIGNSVPLAELHVAETSISATRGILSSQHNTGTQSGRFTTYKSRGTFASPSIIITADSLGSFASFGYDGTNYIESGSMIFSSTGTIGTGIIPSTWKLSTMTAAGVLTQAVLIDQTQAATFANTVTATTFVGALTGNASTVTSGVYTTNNLSVLASTTSAQLAGVMSDETGFSSGAVLVFSKSPSIDSPTFTTAINVSDSIFRIQDNGDATKQIAFEASGITTATTRTLTAQNWSGTIVTTGGANDIGAFPLTANSVVLGGAVNELWGGSASGGNFTIGSTSNATKGIVTIDSLINFSGALATIGINTAAVSNQPITASASIAGTYRGVIINSSTGTSASSQFGVQNSAAIFLMQKLSTFFTTSGLLNASLNYLVSNTGNMLLATTNGSNLPIQFAIGGTAAANQQLEIASTGTKFFTGINNNGSGFKHARVTTGSIAAGSTALVTVTWSTAFADTSYTVQASVLDSTTTSLSLSVVHIESIAAGSITVRVINNSVGALTGTLHCVAIHD